MSRMFSGCELWILRLTAANLSGGSLHQVGLLHGSLAWQGHHAPPQQDVARDLVPPVVARLPAPAMCRLRFRLGPARQGA